MRSTKERLCPVVMPQ